MLELNSSTDTNVSHVNGSYRFDYDISKETQYFDITQLVLSLSGLILNISIVFVILLLKGPLKTHLKFILSLAISDLIIAFVHLVSVFTELPTGLKFYAYQPCCFVDTTFVIMYVMAQYAGLGTMLVISVDILIKIRKPLTYKILMSKRRGNIIIICLWFVSPVIFICISFILQAFILDISTVPSLALAVASRLFFMLCVLFFVVFVILYIIIICSIRNFAVGYSSKRKSSIKKAAITFLFVILTYFLCLMPIVWLLIPLVYFKISHPYLHGRSLTCLYIVNTLCDPIIYILRLPEIKEKYLSLYRKVCQRGHNESAEFNLAE